MPIIYAGQAFTIGNNVAYSGNGYGAAKLTRCTVGYDFAIFGKPKRIHPPRLRSYPHQRANLGCISTDNRDAQFTQQAQGALGAQVGGSCAYRVQYNRYTKLVGPLPRTQHRLDLLRRKCSNVE